MKLKLYTLFILLLCGMATYSQEQAPDWAWAKSAEGNGYDWVNGIVTDAIGNVYITGYFDGTTITFGNTILTNANEGRSDIFIVKYAPNGNVIWAKRAGGNENDRSNNITTDEEGNVYLTGYFGSSTLTFGTTTLTNTGGTDIFIVKYTATGDVVWAKSADGGYCDEGIGITTDEAENVYLTGYFDSNSITFGNITLNNLGNNNTHDIFIAKYNSNGNVIWAKSFGGNSADYGTSITTDNTGNIYFIGNFSSSTITIGNTTLTQVGGGDIFFVKCDINGNVIWAKSFGGSNYDGGISIITDEIGSVYFTGSFMSSTVIFDTTTLTNINAGYYDIFIAKYNPNGNMIWAKSAGGGDNDVSNSISTDKVGNVYLTGDFSFSNITFGDITLTNAGYDDIFITEYDSNGNVLWAKRAGSDNFDYGRSITIDAMGNIYLTGDFWSNTITFGNTTLNNTGFLDVFTTRLNLSTGNNGPVCEGFPLNLNVSSNPEATFAWTGPNGFSSAEQNPIVSNSATTAMSGTYDVTVTLNGMSGTGSTQVTVKPTPSTPVASNNGPVCSGNVLSLTASTIPDATYLWTGPNGFTSIEQNPIVSNNATTIMSGTYNVTATVNGCTSPAGSTTVMVNETPATPMTGNNGPVCEGSELSLTASFVPEATYLWTGPNGFTSTEQNPIVSNNATATMSGTYSVTASLSNGCTSDISSTQVTVNAIPSTPVAGSNGPVCEGSALTLNTSYVWNASYSWTGPDGFTSSEQNPVVSYQATPVMSGSYYVTVTVNGCSSPAGSVIATVNATPETPIAENNGPVCLGSMLSLSASSISNASYHWTGPNGFASSEQNPVVSNNAQPGMSGLYYVVVTDNNGCVSESGLANVSIIDIQPTPNICVISVDSITGKNLVVWDKPLTGAIHHFNVFVEGNQANVFEHIGTVDYNSLSIYIDTLSAPAQLAYRYKISAVDTCGNETELSDYHKSIHLSISQGMGTTFNLAWSHYEGFSYSTYNIYRGTTPASMILLTTVSSTIDSYTDLTPPAGYVYYQIEAVNPNPCSPFKQGNYNSARSNIVSNNVNAVPEYPNESEISIYPNPANDKLTITIPTYSAVNHTMLELFDIYGKLLKSITITESTTIVDVSGYPSGVYVVRFMDEKGIVSKRIIKR